MAALPDRALPELEPGVTIDGLATVEACDAALDRLTMAIVSIEDQLARTRRSSNQPSDWRSRTEMALRIKKMLLPRVQERRADLKRQARQLNGARERAERVERIDRKRKIIIAIAWMVDPEVMRKVVLTACEQHPDLFGDGEAA